MIELAHFHGVENEDQDVTIDVTTNDTDLDGSIDKTSVTIKKQPKNGIVTVDPTTGKITYVPTTNTNGNDTLVYEVCDNGSPVLCDTALVVIKVNAVNDGPIANKDEVTTNEDQDVTIDVTSNDTDLDGSIDKTSVTIKKQPKNGTENSRLTP